MQISLSSVSSHCYFGILNIIRTEFRDHGILLYLLLSCQTEGNSCLCVGGGGRSWAGFYESIKTRKQEMRNNLQLALKVRLMNLLICEATEMILKRYLQMKYDRKFFLYGFFLVIAIGVRGGVVVKMLGLGSRRLRLESPHFCGSLLGDSLTCHNLSA